MTTSIILHRLDDLIKGHSIDKIITHDDILIMIILMRIGLNETTAIRYPTGLGPKYDQKIWTQV